MPSNTIAVIQTMKSLIMRRQKRKCDNEIYRRKLKVMILQTMETQRIITLKILKLKLKGKTKIWTVPELWHPKPNGFYEEVVVKLSDERFQKKFRVSRTVFIYLCNTLEDTLHKSDTVMRNATSVEKRVIIALHILKSNCDLGSVADLYKVGKSSVGHIVQEVCQAIVQRLYHKQIRLPSLEEERDILANKFSQKCNFPNTFGALDGTHIPIKKPTTSAEDYFNYKQYFSINVLAMVDDDYIFRYINTGRPGGIHDAAILRDSLLFKFFEENKTKHHILADGAFPLKSWLLKPYSGSSLSPVQQYFNYRLSSARMRVENAFGRLKGRWRMLLKRIDFDLNNTKQIIKCCIVLHNLCEKYKCQFYERWLERFAIEEQDFLAVPQPNFRETRTTSGQQKRDVLATQLYADHTSG